MQTASKPRKKKSAPQSGKRRGNKDAPQEERSFLLTLVAAACSGALLGLSAPGFDQWYLAWFGLVPLLLLTVSSPSAAQAFVRALVFGTAYNLVYLNWYLGLHPLEWLGFSWWQSMLLAFGAWLIESVHQGLIIGAFAGICKLLPLTGGFIPRRVEGKLHWPCLVMIPLVWTLVVNKLGNAHDALGVPWSMLEYSQYHQLPLLQLTSIVGGIGLGFIIVMFNVALAGLLATAAAKASWKSLSTPTGAACVRQLLTVALLLFVGYAWGLESIARSHLQPIVDLKILQGNVNIDMERTRHRYTLAELYKRYKQLIAPCPGGLCVWTESALPAYLKKEAKTSADLGKTARAGKMDMVIGSMDSDASGKPYNSAFGITSGGKLLPEVYHKRYLVPFGEYTPLLVKYMPEFVQRLTNTPAESGFSAGTTPVVLSLACGKIAPLICFECLSPEIVSSSVREGGGLLVNISDLAWFHDSMIGQQMIAFSVLRATESKRYFVFAANSGPSAIIEPTGKIGSTSQVSRMATVSGKVGISYEQTAFSRWFR